MTTDEQFRALREALAAARACILLDRTSVADCHAAPDGRVDEDGAAALEDYDAVLAQIDAAAPLIDALEAAQRDAERYRFIRDADRSDCITPELGLYAMESLDEYVDAAMEDEARNAALTNTGA